MLKNEKLFIGGLRYGYNLTLNIYFHMFPQNLCLWLDWIINHGRALNCLCGKCAAIKILSEYVHERWLEAENDPFFYYSGYVFLPSHFARNTISLQSLLALQVLPTETPACFHASATISLLIHLLSIHLPQVFTQLAHSPKTALPMLESYPFL